MSQKVFIAQNNTATFVCPECQKSKTTDVSKYKNIETAVRVKCKCPCGHSYSVLLERRKHIRKNLNLTGTFINIKNSGRGNMTVTDLSRSGLRIKLNSPQDLVPGDKLNLEFILDDKQRSVVNKEVIVRSIKNLSIGAEFSHTEHYDKLGSYLLFNFG
ncbi:MAG: PilZ domain-containing protein [Deltaproteobacteria bacterium]|nr:PilZ domain-containing protein [Deltaproteobacteria bacterium]